MAVLATLPPDELRQAVATEDVDALCLVPGVGKKTAQRMVLELKNRLDVAGYETDGLTSDPAVTSSALTDVREALIQMGFGPDEVRHAVEDLQGDDTPTMLREALRRMNRQ